jgi:two-component system OmpR family sensor kinase/two-component system sensor histidine kinase QseC
MWWLVGVSLVPLQRVLAAARSRDAASLQPLPVDGLPSEVAPLVLAFNALLERLATAFDAQRSFVADAAHELRTPLTALKLQIGLLRDTPEGPEREQALSRLRGGVDRSVHLVAQLLALARAEPGHAAPMQDLDLVAVARLALSESAPLAAQRGAEVTLEAPPALPMQGNPQALHSLLRNLVDNAIQHAGRAPHVLVSLRAEAHGVRVWVDDDGAGIPASERDRAFDRFHRREGGGGADGSGLGLAIVQAIAQQHGGKVALADAPGGGLRVDVALPSAQGAVPGTA